MTTPAGRLAPSQRTGRSIAAGLAVSLTLLLAACATDSPAEPTTTETTSGPTTAAPTPAPESPDATIEPGTGSLLPTGQVETVVAGLEAPWSIAFSGQTTLLSLRDSGQILEVLSENKTRVVATVPGVKHGGEGGLLGIVVSADGALFAYSTGAQGNRIQRFELTGEPGSYGLSAPTTLVDQIPSAGNHNGGRLAIGPDGLLYASTGDAGQTGNSQEVSSLAGKILRLNLDGSVPADNPFPDSYVFTYGHRNVQGLAWAQDGTMFATEFGQSTWDELNIITPGANYGWPLVEGIEGNSDGFTAPVQQWATSAASPSGMVHIGETLFIANLRGSVLRAVPVAAPGTSREFFGGELGRLRDAALSPTGDLWLLTNNTDGRGNPGPEDDRIVAVPLTSS